MNSGMLFGADEIGALVFDLGSHSFRVGSTLDNTPKADIPTAVGVSINGSVGISSPELNNDNNCVNHKTKYYTDITSLCVPRKGKLLIFESSE